MNSPYLFIFTLSSQIELIILNIKKVIAYIIEKI
ncbi:unnamed protein product, partial [marine sediment metagenome]